MKNLVQKWRELVPFYFPATAAAFTFAPLRRAPPILFRANVVVALKVAQVPCTVQCTWPFFRFCLLVILYFFLSGRCLHYVPLLYSVHVQCTYISYTDKIRFCNTKNLSSSGCTGLSYEKQRRTGSCHPMRLFWGIIKWPYRIKVWTFRIIKPV